MPNDWFQFKHFKIEQGDCGMKVSTDACLFGAYTANFAYGRNDMNSVLDVGTGTGLLSLMLAQKLPASLIDAIEPEPKACRQAAANFKNTNWTDRLTVTECTLQQWKGSGNEVEIAGLYDLIICNPPFFGNQMEARDPARNVARHHVCLTLPELCAAVKYWLAPAGIFAMLYPAGGWQDFHQAALSEGLFLHSRVDIYPGSHKKCNRHIGFWTKQPVPPTVDFLEIYRHDGSYTQAFENLLKDYYLNL